MSEHGPPSLLVEISICVADILLKRTVKGYSNEHLPEVLFEIQMTTTKSDEERLLMTVQNLITVESDEDKAIQAVRDFFARIRSVDEASALEDQEALARGAKLLANLQDKS